MPVRLPPIQAIIDLHQELIDEHGGAPGIRDRGMLEQSMARPGQITAYNPKEAGPIELATALCVSINQNHPFVDGNKRIAFASLGVVLMMNNLYLDVAESHAEKTMMSLSAGEISEDAFLEWVCKNVYPISDDDID